MKKGKRLLTILFAALALFLMGTAASFAATGDVTETHSGNTYTFTYQSGTDEYQSRTYKFSAPDQVYDGDEYDRGADFQHRKRSSHCSSIFSDRNDRCCLLSAGNPERSSFPHIRRRRCSQKHGSSGLHSGLSPMLEPQAASWPGHRIY